MSAPRVLVEPTGDAAVARAAELVVEAARASSGRFRMALSGGHTPQGMHRLLSGPLRERLPWDACQWWFGDDRCVGPDDPASNYRAARESLFEPAEVPDCSIFRIEGERGPAEAAGLYEKELRDHFHGRAWPEFDLVQLGLGSDGHTASLFPGTDALEEKTRWVVPGRAPTAPRDRVSLSLPAINSARRVVFLVSGAEKADAAKKALSGGGVPAARVRPVDGELVWVLDAAAAARL